MTLLLWFAWVFIKVVISTRYVNESATVFILQKKLQLNKA